MMMMMMMMMMMNVSELCPESRAAVQNVNWKRTLKLLFNSKKYKAVPLHAMEAL
jgi:hypothetical protein